MISKASDLGQCGFLPCPERCPQGPDMARGDGWCASSCQKNLVRSVQGCRHHAEASTAMCNRTDTRLSVVATRVCSVEHAQRHQSGSPCDLQGRPGRNVSVTAPRGAVAAPSGLGSGAVPWRWHPTPLGPALGGCNCTTICARASRQRSDCSVMKTGRRCGEEHGRPEAVLSSLRSAWHVLCKHV